MEIFDKCVTRNFSVAEAQELTSHVKPISLCHVYCWGNGIGTPVKLPLPTYETIITQVASGRTQKAAVTKNGRVFVWEVRG